jgi:hypothetical protein
MTVDIKQQIHLLRHSFLCREDKIAFRAKWGSPCPADGGAHIEALLRAHLLGEAAPKALIKYHTSGHSRSDFGRYRLGAYSPNPKGETKWLCLDFDGGDHAEALADPQNLAIMVWERFQRVELPAYLERSGSGTGWHLWCFFAPAISAATARALAQTFLPEEVTLAGGECVPTMTGRGIEVFPKQMKIERNGYGNLVWLPWWSGAPPGANQFYQLVDDILHPYLPTEFEVAPLDVISQLLPTPPPQIAEDTPAEQSGWRAWRETALAALPLESVYGEWLTGTANGPGWLECRDPWSPSGDRNPSAGVADGRGQAERGTFSSFISGEKLSVFDFLIKRGVAADFAAAQRSIAELSGVPLPQVRGQRARTSSLPQIIINGRQLRDLVHDTWHILHAANQPPVLFQRSGLLVRLRKESRAGLHIEPVDDDSIYGLLSRIADWMRLTDDGLLNALPSREVARDMLAYPDERLPCLEAIATTPVYSSEGILIDQPGYQAEDALWYQPSPQMTEVGVPLQPSPEEIAAAKSLFFDEVLVDFPLEAACDRAHALAAFLQPFLRRMILGPTPLYVVTAPTEGSGKGLFCKLVSIVATGTEGEAGTLPDQTEEVRKLITAALSLGRPIILLDNAKKGRILDCAPLAAALTADIWTDRLLGRTQMVSFSNRALWLLTGNNTQLSAELARRHVRIRINPRVEQTWRRGGFKHDPITVWAKQQRTRIVSAALTLIQAWLAAGAPRAPEFRLGSFESWAETLGGVLKVAGVPGFLGHLEELYETIDAEGSQWREFVASWWQVFGPEPTKVAALNDHCEEQNLMNDVRGEATPRSQQSRLGRALRTARDRVFGTYQIVWIRPNTRHKGSTWYALSPLEPEAAVNSSADLGTSPENWGLHAPCPQKSPHAENGSTTPFSDTIGDIGDFGDFYPDCHAEAPEDPSPSASPSTCASGAIQVPNVPKSAAEDEKDVAVTGFSPLQTQEDFLARSPQSPQSAVSDAGEAPDEDAWVEPIDLASFADDG